MINQLKIDYKKTYLDGQKQVETLLFEFISIPLLILVRFKSFMSRRFHSNLPKNNKFPDCIRHCCVITHCNPYQCLILKSMPFYVLLGYSPEDALQFINAANKDKSPPDHEKIWRSRMKMATTVKNYLKENEDFFLLN